MNKRKPATGDDNAEQNVWSAWSKVEQDVTKADSMHGFSNALDAMESSALQIAKLQSAVVRGTCGNLQANPLLPREARALVEQTCKPLLSLSGWQQHLIPALFGMARHAAISVPNGQRPHARH